MQIIFASYYPKSPIYCLSKLYPVVLDSESMTATCTNESGLLRYPPESIDNAGSAATITGGVLRLQLFAISAPTETVASSASITSGELRVALRHTDMQPEGFNAVATITGGSLTAILVTSTMQPEGFNAVATITGGSLT